VIPVKSSYQDVHEQDGFPRPLDEMLRKLDLDLSYRSYVQAALTHPSFWGEFAIPEEARLEKGYERLEFLGDSVIALTTCSYLFHTHHDYDQGKLSKIKGHLVSKSTLTRVAKSLEIGDYIRVGKGVLHGAGRKHSTFLVDCFEALVGAVFLEKGFDYASRFVLSSLKEEIEKVTVIEALDDYKTELQELVQKQYRTLPHYKLLSQTGPEHRKIFHVAVFIDNRQVGEGEGSSKKEAETSAAKMALEELSDS
jgi:ribonuclease III